jgi:cytoskeletal protein CcmA (bactofilin family)
MAFSNVEKNYSTESGPRTLLTIVGDYAVLDGKFKISQSIEIDCELKGKLAVDGKITIQQNGFVSADVKTKEAEIIGRYVGDMEATGNVVIRESGIAMGNIKTDSLVINKGGIFTGNITRITESTISLDEKPADTTIMEKTYVQEKERGEEIYSGSSLASEIYKSTAYDVNIGEDNNTI